MICFNLLIFFLNLQLNQCGCFLSTSFHTDSNRLAGIFRGGASKPSQYLTGGTMADGCIAGLAFWKTSRLQLMKSEDVLSQRLTISYCIYFKKCLLDKQRCWYSFFLWFPDMLGLPEYVVVVPFLTLCICFPKVNLPRASV